MAAAALSNLLSIHPCIHASLGFCTLLLCDALHGLERRVPFTKGYSTYLHY